MNSDLHAMLSTGAEAVGNSIGRECAWVGPGEPRDSRHRHANGVETISVDRTLDSSSCERTACSACLNCTRHDRFHIGCRVGVWALRTSVLATIAPDVVPGKEKPLISGQFEV